MAITSRQNALVARYRAAARGDSAKLILLDGVQLGADALAAGLTIQHAAACCAADAHHDVADLLARLNRAGAEVATVSASVMDALSPVRSSSSIVALAERPVPRDAAMYATPPSLTVIAVDVQDPGNVGAIVRVAEAGGASGFYAAGISADPFGWKALRGSMGSALRLPLRAVPSPAIAIDEARAHGCRIIATVPRDGTPLFDADLTGSLALLIGGEGQGLSESVLASADERITIPMQTPVESLNAAVSAALIVYEVRRQRRRENA